MGEIINNDTALGVFDEDGVGEIIDHDAEEIATLDEFLGAFLDSTFERLVGGLERFFLFTQMACAPGINSSEAQQSEAAYGKLEPNGLVKQRRQFDIKGRAARIPDAIYIACADLESITAGMEIGI